MLSIPRYKSVRLIPFLVLSGFLHAVLIAALPDMTRYFNIHLNRLALLTGTVIEVTLVEPEIIPEPEPPSVEKSASLLADDYVSTLIDQCLKELFALGEAPLSPPAPIELPVVMPLDKSTLQAFSLPETVVLARPQELLGRFGKKPAGRLSGQRLGGTPKIPIAESGSLVEALLAFSGKKSLLLVNAPQKAAAEEVYGLSGPVARSRQVLFRPELPKISLVKDATVDFRFWVRPDGSVSRVETLKIGDLKLVNVAERFLQQWRFSILESDLPQQEQWGTISIVFRVPR